MDSSRPAHRPTLTAVAVAALAVVGLTAGGCGQVSVGEQATTGTGTSSAAPSATSSDLSPGSDAATGCADLVDPVHRLVHGVGDTAVDSAEVRESSDGLDDNALSAVASRISGLAAQSVVDPAVLDDQWDQFRQICDLP